jgi:hypothetical protein
MQIHNIHKNRDNLVDNEILAIFKMDGPGDGISFIATTGNGRYLL